MTLKYFAPNRITGTSSDRTGGTWTNLPTPYFFFETDTLKTFYWTGNVWSEQVVTGAGGGGAPDISRVIYVAQDGTGDYTTLQAAITAQGVNKEYKLNPGVHSISSQLVIALSNVTIKGSGVGITTLQIEPAVGSTGAGIVVSGSLGQSKALSANSLRGVNTLSVASSPAHGISAGDWIYLKCTRQIQSAGNNGTDAEIHQVKAATSTLITLKDYLYEDYTTALTSTVYKINWVSNFTLRDLTVYDGRTTPVTGITEQADCLFLFCYNLKLMNVVFDRMYYCSCALQNCYNCDLTNVAYDSPQFLNSATYWVNYGLDILSASTNISVNGGWANRCRHSVTTDCVGGQAYGGGRQRNITINGMKSYNSNTSHFDTHEGVAGAVFNGCVAIGGYHQLDADYVYSGAHSQQTDQVKGFTARSPTVYNGCVAQNCENYGFAFFNDNDTASSGDSQPGSDGTIMTNCRIQNTQTGDGTSVGVTRGVRILPNRKDISIIDCYFSNILEEPIMVGDGANNIIIKGNQFHTCGASLSASRGLIRFLGNHDDVIITDNIFGAGTASGSAHPVEFATSVDRLIFKDNDVNGLTNKSLIVPTASTAVNIHDNLSYNPIGSITNPIGTSTIGLYGGTTATITTATDYTIVGCPVLVTVTGGTVSDITIKDPAGNTVSSAETSIKSRYIPVGFKLRVTHTGAPTTTVFGV